MLLLWQRSRQTAVDAGSVSSLLFLLSATCSPQFATPYSTQLPSGQHPWPILAKQTHTPAHTPHTLSMCALCHHHLLDGSLRDFSSRVAMSVCLRFLCACCRIAFTTTTNTTIANYSPIPSSLSPSLSFSLFSLSICACCGSFIHSFIYITQPTTRTRPAHFAHSSCSFNLILDSAFLSHSLSLHLCLFLLTWLLLGVVVASRFYSFCAHAIH